jgi:hypothetical protein
MRLLQAMQRVNGSVLSVKHWPRTDLASMAECCMCFNGSVLTGSALLHHMWSTPREPMRLCLCRAHDTGKARRSKSNAGMQPGMLSSISHTKLHQLHDTRSKGGVQMSNLDPPLRSLVHCLHLGQRLFAALVKCRVLGAHVYIQ